MNAADLKPNDKVKYHDTPATVVDVCRNGVRVGYWFKSSNMIQPEYRVERVAARYLTAA